MTGVAFTSAAMLAALAGVFFILYRRAEARVGELIEERAQLAEEREGLADALDAQVATFDAARRRYEVETNRLEADVDRLRERLRDAIGPEDRDRVVSDFVDEFVRGGKADTAGSGRDPG